MPEWIPPEHRDTDYLLKHWGRWVRSSTTQGYCGSIEHRYKSPQCWYPPNPKPEQPDELAALLIERFMRIIAKQPRKLLKFKYVYQADQAYIAQRLKLKDYDQALYTARQIILNLTSPSIKRTLARNSSSQFVYSG